MWEGSRLVKDDYRPQVRCVVSCYCLQMLVGGGYGDEWSKQIGNGKWKFADSASLLIGTIKTTVTGTHKK